MDDERLILRTARLDLHTVLPGEYRLLAVDRSDPRLWADRGFANPAGHLVADPGPLPHRIPRIEADPQAAPFLLRMAVLRAAGTIIGSAGFHDLPDASGAVEIGLGIEPGFRRQGYATEVLHGMWGWVIDQPGVSTLRYTVAAGNVPSVALVRGLGFAQAGEQVDAVDGLELVFEMPADAYRDRYGSQRGDG